MSSKDERFEAAREVKLRVAEAIEAHRAVGYDQRTTQALVAREYRAGKLALAEFRAEHQAMERARARDASQAIYGADDLRGQADPGTHAASYRDAQDRASKLGSAAEAARLMRQAERSGDELLARAVAAKAFDRKWGEVVDDYRQDRPAWGEAVENVSDTRLSVGMGSAIVFGLRKPDELNRMVDGQIESFVRDSKEIYDRIDSPEHVPSVATAGGGVYLTPEGAAARYGA